VDQVCGGTALDGAAERRCLLRFGHDRREARVPAPIECAQLLFDVSGGVAVATTLGERCADS
jgi:hypothetical protein